MNFIRLIPLCSELGVAPSTVWRWVRAKRFPAPVKIGANTTVWVRDEVDLWKAQRVAARRQAEVA